jgi:hypothetical protein
MLAFIIGKRIHRLKKRFSNEYGKIEEVDKLMKIWDMKE